MSTAFDSRTGAAKTKELVVPLPSNEEMTREFVAQTIKQVVVNVLFQTHILGLEGVADAVRSLPEKAPLNDAETVQHLDRILQLAGLSEYRQLAQMVLSGREEAERLGGGGFSSVFRIRERTSDIDDESQGSSYILKFQGNCPPERFKLEMETMSVASQAPWRITPHFLGNDSKNRGAVCYKMEDIPGAVSLDKIADLIQIAPLEKKKRYLAALGAQIGAGLEWLHQRGFIHRDMKPGNILVYEDQPESACMIDFGLIKKIMHVDDPHLTTGGVGTPAFADPKQFDENEPDTSQVDVRGLCATLFFLWTGSIYKTTKDLIKIEDDEMHSILAEGLHALSANRSTMKVLIGRLAKIIDMAPEFDKQDGSIVLRKPFLGSLRKKGVGLRPPSELLHDSLELHRPRSVVERHLGKLLAGGVAAVAVISLAIAGVVHNANKDITPPDPPPDPDQPPAKVVPKEVIEQISMKSIGHQAQLVYKGDKFQKLVFGELPDKTVNVPVTSGVNVAHEGNLRGHMWFNSPHDLSSRLGVQMHELPTVGITGAMSYFFHLSNGKSVERIENIGIWADNYFFAPDSSLQKNPNFIETMKTRGITVLPYTDFFKHPEYLPCVTLPHNLDVSPGDVSKFPKNEPRIPPHFPQFSRTQWEAEFVREGQNLARGFVVKNGKKNGK